MGNGHDAEDFLNTALTKTVSAMANGFGPRESFPAHPSMTVKGVAPDIWSRSCREPSVESHQLESSREPYVYEYPEEPTEAHDHVTSAMQSLPARWQTVLWYSEVMQEPQRRIGPLMGIRPNAVSALLRRAKAGLRRAYTEAEEASASDH